MLDGLLRRMIDPALARLGRRLVAAGVQADQVTVASLVLGLACAGAIVFGQDLAALALLAAGRLADGLDGAVARVRGPTDRGGFLDITFDFIFYGSVPLAFALRDPVANALPAAVLLAAFYANGASFLAFAALAAKRGLSTEVRGVKSLYFTVGLMEGSETIAFFAAFILAPSWFPALALLFALLCFVTCLSRLMLGIRVFGGYDARD